MCGTAETKISADRYGIDRACRKYAHYRAVRDKRRPTMNDNTSWDQSEDAQARKESGMRDVGIVVVSALVVAALAIGGFQWYKSSQSADDNPAGFTETQAVTLISNGINDCMLPENLVDAVGLSDLEYSETSDAVCQAYLATEDGHNETKITIGIDDTEAQGDDAPIEGWIMENDASNGNSISVEHVAEELSNGNPTNGVVYPGCVMKGTEQGIDNVFLAGPDCDVLYPIADQLTNLVKQARFAEQETGFFELKSQPDYAPVQWIESPDITISGFAEAFAEAPQGKQKFTIPQEDFKDAPFEIRGQTIEDSGEDTEVCLDVSFTLPKTKDGERGTYYYPAVYFVAADGLTIGTMDRDAPNTLEEGDVAEYKACKTIPHADVDKRGLRTLDHLILLGYPKTKDGDRQDDFLKDGKVNVVGKFTVEN